MIGICCVYWAIVFEQVQVCIFSKLSFSMFIRILWSLCFLDFDFSYLGSRWCGSKMWRSFWTKIFALISGAYPDANPRAPTHVAPAGLFPNIYIWIYPKCAKNFRRLLHLAIVMGRKLWGWFGDYLSGLICLKLVESFIETTFIIISFKHEDFKWIVYQRNICGSFVSRIIW